MFKYIITYRFTGNENDPGYHKRRKTFLDLLRENEHEEDETTSTIFVKSFDKVESFFSDLGKNMNEKGCPFKNDDNVTVFILQQIDENKNMYYHFGSLTLVDGIFEEFDKLNIWFDIIS